MDTIQFLRDKLTPRWEEKRQRKIRQFFDFSLAFAYCREVNTPVTVMVEENIYNLYPSGHSDLQIKCECGSLDNHLDCPVHGVYEWKREGEI